MTWFQQLIRRWKERRPDPAWKPTGIKQKFSGYDDTKPTQAARRAEELAAQRRALAQQRAGLRKP